MKTWRAKLFSNLASFFGKKDDDLPFEVIKAIQSKDLGLATCVVQGWASNNKSERNGEVVGKVAAQYGWLGVDLDKLIVFTHYYSDQVAIAYEGAKKYIGEGNKDLDIDMLTIAGYILYRTNNFIPAYQLIRRVGDAEAEVSERPDFLMLRSLVCWSYGDVERARVSTKRMVELSPQDQVILQNAFTIQVELGDEDEIDKIRGTLEGLGCRGYAYGLPLIALGEFELGYSCIDSRFHYTELERYINPALLPFPRWQGEDIAGKTLLVTAEQGLGDTIQMARFFPMLQQRLGGRLTVEAQREVVPLLQENFPDIEVVSRQLGQVPRVSFDLWMASMSLPFLLGIRPDTIPGKAGYLRSTPEVADYWQKRVSELAGIKRAKVGVAWSGQPNHRSDRRRSIPWEKFSSYLPQSDIIFFSLQTSVPGILPSYMVSVSEELITLADTAALIDQLDLVITVDTSVVHLAGALGKPTWLLLPYRYEWRWGLQGKNNNWYDSVTVFRQESHGDWDGLLKLVLKHNLIEYFGL